MFCPRKVERLPRPLWDLHRFMIAVKAVHLDTASRVLEVDMVVDRNTKEQTLKLRISKKRIAKIFPEVCERFKVAQLTLFTELRILWIQDEDGVEQDYYFRKDFKIKELYAVCIKT